jgi:L-lactate dehydrogenase complex protein LldF
MEFMNPVAFKDNAREALADENLRDALNRMGGGLVPNRQAAIDALPEFEQLRERGREIKDHTLENLDHYLEVFERNCLAAGGHVHWAPDAADARDIILDICQSAGARVVTKGKSMIAEEIGLNHHLEKHEITPVETDLGEYIVQLAQEPPSHIIGPAVHKTKEQVSDLFHEKHRQYGRDERLTEAGDLIQEAREVLRQKYFDADVGITGANFLVAETGSTVIVTNEGNGDLTQSLPKTHIVITSIDKVIPTLEDTATILRLLARSATGQNFSAYTTYSTGPRREEDLDGPEAFHVVILDNGRSAMLGSEVGEMLRCIRCGACMNHCPVYHSVGGHTYGAVYVGPMGSVLSPSLFGIDKMRHLPNASTFCGRCESVCPMKIPLPKMMRFWREQAFQEKQNPFMERVGIGVWAFFARHAWLYNPLARLAARVLAQLGQRGGGRIAKLPLAGGWTRGRDLPAPEGRTFQESWRRRQRATGRTA